MTLLERLEKLANKWRKEGDEAWAEGDHKEHSSCHAFAAELEAVLKMHKQKETTP